jgi:hypothetical protein
MAAFLKCHTIRAMARHFRKIILSSIGSPRILGNALSARCEQAGQGIVLRDKI